MAEYKLRIVIEGEDKASGALGGVANSLQRIGEFAAGGVIAHGITKGIGGLKNLFTGAIASAADFEQTLNFMQQVFSATDEQMAMLTEQALQLGRETVFSSVEAAQGQVELAKAGMSVQQTFDAMPGVLSLAAAGQIGIADAAVVASNAINAYQLEANEMLRVADLYAAAANASSVDIADLAMSQRMASAVAASYGISIEDVTTALAIMGNYGLRNSDAGTSLKQMLMSLFAPTEKAAGVMEEMGINIYDATGAARPFVSILEDLYAATASISDQEKAASFDTIFGSDAVRAANILIEAGTEGWASMAEQVNQYGAAQQLAEAQTRGLAGALEYFKGTWESMTVEGATPLLAGLSDAIRNIADIMSSPEIMDGIRTFAAQAGAVLELTVSQFFGAFSTAGGGFAGIQAGLEAVIGMSFEEIPGKLRAAMIAGLKGIGQELWTSISTGISTWATTQFAQIKTQLGQQLSQLWTGMQAALPMLVGALFPQPAWLDKLTSWSWPEFSMPSWLTNLFNWDWPYLQIPSLFREWTWPTLTMPEWLTGLFSWTWPTLSMPEWITNLMDWKWPTLTMPSWVNRLWGRDEKRDETQPVEQTIENPLANFNWHWPELPEFAWPTLPAWVWPEIAMPSWLWPDIPKPGWIDSLQVPRPSWLGELLAWSPIVTVRSGGATAAPPGMGMVPMQATGTRYWRGGVTMVGEHGPELVALPRGAAVYSAAQSRNLLAAAASGGPSVNVTAHVYNDLDVQSLAYRVADVISRRRR